MNPQHQFPSESSRDNSRSFKCPCGKNYLSNAALYTHIKTKHDGQAPGKVQKPKLLGKRRGRPPIPKEGNEHEENPKQIEAVEKVGSNIYKQNFEVIQTYLREIHPSETINLKVYGQEDEAEDENIFNIFQKLLEDQNPFSGFVGEGVAIGMGLTQFFQEVVSLFPDIDSEKNRGQQVFLLFMLLLQYVVDECNDVNIIKQMSIETLVAYFNPFQQDWIQDYAELKEINNLWIMNKNNMIKVFECFYNWLKLKQYTTYCITLI